MYKKLTLTTEEKEIIFFFKQGIESYNSKFHIRTVEIFNDFLKLNLNSGKFSAYYYKGFANMCLNKYKDTILDFNKMVIHESITLINN
jgi:hypothetical protein